MNENKSAYEQLVDACRSVVNYADTPDTGRTSFDGVVADLRLALWVYGVEEEAMTRAKMRTGK